ncbi:MAG: ABC transporter permease [Planctomycetota bacterium]|nr:ABC transporter permease [Planctomycetota bacterium]
MNQDRKPFWYLRRTPDIRRDVRTEIDLHIELTIDELVDSGLSPVEARAEAMNRFGNMDHCRDDCVRIDRQTQQGIKTVMLIQELMQDVRYGVRRLLKSPGFVVVTVLTIALGIGLNTAIFSLVNTILFQPLPYAHADEIVKIYRIDSSNLSANPDFSYPDYLEYRNTVEGFQDLATASHVQFSVGQQDVFEMNIGQVVSGNFFNVFDTRAVLGRLITPDDDLVEGNHPVVVLSHQYWQSKYDGDPSIVGQILIINGHAFTVIGVASEGFAGAMPLIESNLYVPMMMVPQVLPSVGNELYNRSVGWLELVVGRLESDVNIEQLQARLDLATEQMKSVDPQYANEQAVVIKTMGIINSPQSRPILLGIAAIIMSMVGLVLLIVCANVANLMLVKSLTRRKEIAIQLALGSSRFRLIRQLLIEALLLALTGGMLGIWLAALSVDLFNVLLPQLPFNLSLNLVFSLDGRMLAFTFFASVLTGIVFGLAPALQTTGTDMVGALKSDDAHGSAGSFLGSKLRNTLIISQIAISMVLLVGAGLFERSLINSNSLNPGFEHEQVLAISMDLTMMRYDEMTGPSFFNDALERIRELPGVEAASLDVAVPLGFGFNRFSKGLWIEGETPFDLKDLGKHQINTSTISDGEFATLGIPILRGRDFNDQDLSKSSPVTIVNKAFVDEHWPGENVLGRRLSIDGEQGPFAEIVGVVETVKYQQLGESPRPIAYFPIAQRYNPRATLLVRSSIDPLNILPTARGILLDIDPNFVPLETRTLTSLISVALLPTKVAVGMFGLFGILALVLTAVGLFGVMSFVVGQRTQEFGIRIAIGAQQGEVLWLVFKQGMKFTLIGLGFGIVLALLGTRALSRFLYDVSSTDLITYGGVSLVLGSVALLATYIPARRAMNVDPMVALRCE